MVSGVNFCDTFRLIVEKYTNYSWYKHIPFITALSYSSISIDIPDPVQVEEIDQTLLHLPMSHNYSHFISDFLGPWSFFSNFLSYSDFSIVSPLSPTNWQLELLNILCGKSIDILSAPRQPLVPFVVSPKCLYLPVCDSVMYSQHSLRTLIYDELKDQVDQSSTPILSSLERFTGVPSRVVNRHEISTLLSLVEVSQ